MSNIRATLPMPEIQPTGQTVRGRPQFRLLHPFSLMVPMGNSGRYHFRIPAGFVTDFASVPRLLWWIVNPLDPDILVGALIHDDLYSQIESTLQLQTAVGREHAENRLLSRFMCDCWLRFIMDMFDAPLWKQLLVYYAVRVGGRGHYRKGLS